MFQALASLAQPIFNNGKLVANLKVSKAEEEIARMNYQQTILEAGEEVSNALRLYDTQDKKLQHDRQQGRPVGQGGYLYQSIVPKW